jgi:hypothetical protein
MALVVTKYRLSGLKSGRQFVNVDFLSSFAQRGLTILLC